MLNHLKNVYLIFLKETRYELFIIISLVILISGTDLLIIGMLYNFLYTVSGTTDNLNTLMFGDWNISIYHKGVSIITLMIILAGMKLIYLSKAIRYSQNQRAKISGILTRIYTNSFSNADPKFNKKEIVTLSISEVDLIISTIFYPAFQVLASMTTSLIIVSFLFFTNPYLTLLVIFVALLFYISIFKYTSSSTDKLTKNRDQENSLRHVAMLDYAQHLREIIVENRAAEEFNVINRHTTAMSNYLASILYRAQMTRFILEPLVFVSLILLLLDVYTRPESDQQALLSQAGIFIYAVFKILPAAQSMYQTLIQFKIGAPTLTRIIDIYLSTRSYLTDEPREIPSVFTSKITKLITTNLSLTVGDIQNKTHIVYPDLCFKTGNVNFLKGPSGSGKTSYFDYLLGFITADQGTTTIVREDGQKTGCENIRADVAYVPQFPQLKGANMATVLGCNDTQLTDARHLMERLGLDAHVHLLETNNETVNFSDNFSGGEIQRLCLARAILRGKKIYLLDEVTSALDDVNQQRVMQVLSELSDSALIIMISHENSNTTVGREVML